MLRGRRRECAVFDGLLEGCALDVAARSELGRETGALTVLPFALSARSGAYTFTGELGAATSLLEEVDTVGEAIGSHFPPANGYAGSGGGWKLARSSAPRTRCARGWVSRRSRGAPSASCWPRESARANAATRRATT